MLVEIASSVLLTIPELNRRYRIGLHSLRQAVRRGEFPVYGAGTSWPRVKRSDFEKWLESTRIERDNRVADPIHKIGTGPGSAAGGGATGTVDQMTAALDDAVGGRDR